MFNTVLQYKCVDGIIPVQYEILPGDVHYFMGRDIPLDVRTHTNKGYMQYFQIEKGVWEKKRREEQNPKVQPIKEETKRDITPKRKAVRSKTKESSN